MLEIRLEEKSKQKVNKFGGEAFKLKNAGFKGLPDRMILFPGQIIFFVEFKKPGGAGVLSAQQEKIHATIRTLGFNVYIIDNSADFDAVLEKEIGPA